VVKFTRDDDRRSQILEGMSPVRRLWSKRTSSMNKDGAYEKIVYEEHNKEKPKITY
jgi:hypothetical protein